MSSQFDQSFTTEPRSRRNGAHREQTLAVFPQGSVVQLVSGRADAPDAVVSTLHRATVTITDERITATDGSIDWSWLVADLEAVVIGADEPWTILMVPGVSDFGVAVPGEDAGELHRALVRIPTVRVLQQQPRLTSASGPAHADAAVAPDLSGFAQWTEVPARSPEPLDLWSRAHNAARSSADQIIDLSRLGASSARVEPVAPASSRASGAPIAPVAPAAVPPPPGIDIYAPTTQVPLRPPPLAPSIPPPPPPPPTSPPPPTPAAQRTHGRAAGFDAIRAMRQRNAATTLDEITAPMPLAAIEGRSVCAWFGDRLVLDRVSLHMPAGEVTALIGPSGCGKSTFLRILNRMHEMIPSATLAGEVLLDGNDIYDPQRKLTDARREIGMVFQKPNPFPAMSIYDNVLASFRLTGVKATTALKDDVVETCLTKAGLWKEVRDRLRQPGGGLSGGQQQRLCIARALAIRPRVLLMDEPCSALDPTSTRRIEETISELASEVTIVIVTHNMQQAARVSHHCAFFLAEQGTPGAIVEHGPTEAMFNSPQDTRTLDYVSGRFG